VTVATTVGAVGRALDSLGCSWALVGGLAVSLRSQPRFTRDTDFAVAVGNDREAEGIVRGLVQRGYVLVSSIDQIDVARLAAVRLSLPGDASGEASIDMIFAFSGIEPEIVADAERLTVVPGTIAPVAKIGHLIATKIVSEGENRVHDARDLQWLIEVADNEEIARARQGLALSESRGFHAGKDLQATLDQYLARAGRPSA